MRNQLLLPLLALPSLAFSQDFEARWQAGFPKNLGAADNQYNNVQLANVNRSPAVFTCMRKGYRGETLEVRVVARMVTSSTDPKSAHLENIAVQPDLPASQCMVALLKTFTFPPPPRSPLPLSAVFEYVEN